MTDEQVELRRPRRTPAEVETIVSEFEASGLNRSQFCRREGMALITLSRYLKRVRGGSGESAANGELVPVELRGMNASGQREAGCGLTVVLASGYRVEIGVTFDGPTLQRLMQTLETM